ncbi:hypothetical protein GCM10010387_58300 [Streptomyces inusitatus]|uniref:Uncharacterized protein n=1 Tax=Streptomyces inusitatus TaxID=68221 RepID=A0A918QLK7_9ACTN|nr:hypothetical protein [Streptomyces inusitatus]GGZ56639.1 hypothetical protein GCM10010387_58300 [Streptomyces inusitatus]
MQLSRVRRSALLPVFASVLLAMVLALVVALCPPSYADTARSAVPVAQDRTPGCGSGADGDRGAHPAPPSRGGVSYEPAPVPYDTHGAGGAPGSAPCAGAAPDRVPAPLDPPTPLDLSILRL